MSLKRLILPALLALSGCGTPQGFQPKDDATQTAHATGLALTAGQPTDADVYALDADGRTLAHVRSGADGAFSIDLPNAGAVQFSLNDRHGSGGLVSTTIQPTGENLLGDITLVPVEQASRLLTLRNIGFEERLTTGSGDHTYTKYSSDLTHAYSAVRHPASDAFDLVEVDLATGAETVLLADVRPPLDWDPLLALVDDRVLIAQVIRALQRGVPQRRDVVPHEDRLRRAAAMSHSRVRGSCPAS